jgi:hypothetical protein
VVASTLLAWRENTSRLLSFGFPELAALRPLLESGTTFNLAVRIQPAPEIRNRSS